MQIITKALPMSHRIYLFSDTHEGTILKHKAGIKKLVKMIKDDPNAYAIHLGDLAEAITIDDKRYCMDTVDPDTSLPLLQYQAVVREFWDIRDKFITILEGNHDAKIAGKYGNFVRDYVCKELGVPYGTYTSRITINDTKGRLQYKIYAAHGRRSVGSSADDPTRKIANEKLQLKRHLKPMATDCAVMAKGHCFSSDTELLTRKGWKSYDELDEDDTALTFNTSKGTAEWQALQQIHVHRDKYTSLISARSKNVDFQVTKEHRIIHKATGGKEKGGWIEGAALEVMERSQTCIPVAAPSNLPEYNIEDDMLSLIGWVISEGHFRSYGPVQLFQNWSEKHKIGSLLDSLGIEYSLYKRNFKGREFEDPRTAKKYTTKDDGATFYIGVKEAPKIKKYVSDKDIPAFAFDLSDRQFDILLGGLMAGDGTWSRPNEAGTYYTSSKSLADNLQALAISHGWRAQLRHRRNCFELGLVKRTSSYLHKKNKNTEKLVWTEVPATKVVWCVSVPNGAVFVRRNGRACVLGNTHKLIVKEPETELCLVDDGRKIHQKYTKLDQTSDYIHPDLRWYVNTGCFYKLHAMGVSGYAERAEYPPNELGFAVIDVVDGQIKSITPKTI